jgi:hypothetical protein
LADLAGDSAQEIILAMGDMALPLQGADANKRRDRIVMLEVNQGDLVLGWEAILPASDTRPNSLGNGQGYTPQPAAADVDDDDELEIIVGDSRGTEDPDAIVIHVIETDGQSRETWTYGFFGRVFDDVYGHVNAIMSPVTVANVDDDDLMELFHGTDLRHVMAWDCESEHVEDGWPIVLRDRVLGAITVTDVDDDDGLEVVASDFGGWIHVWDYFSGLSDGPGDGSGALGSVPRLKNRLYYSVPNPFNPSTVIRYDIGESRKIKLAIYAVDGRLVRRLIDAHHEPGDNDNDGDMDLYAANKGQRNRLFRNEGAGTFSEVAAAAGVDDSGDGEGVGWFDYDLDGDLDIYLANDGTSNRLFRNDGLQSFYNVADSIAAHASGKINDSGSGRSFSAGDYDSDGDVDIYLGNRNAPCVLFRNDYSSSCPHPQDSWFAVRLEGVLSNSVGIGATVSVEAGGQIHIREISGGGGYLGQDQLQAHFGVGAAEIIDNLEVRWPSGLTGRRSGLAANQLLVFNELESISRANSTVKWGYGGIEKQAPLDDQRFGGCPWNGTDHPGGRENHGLASDYWLEVELKDDADQPVSGVSDIHLDFSGCQGTPHNPPLGTIEGPDAPTDAAGKTVFVDGLLFGGATDCGYTLYVAGNPWESFEGLLNFDITGNGTIELADLATWQQAYLHGGPLYECDFSLNNYCDVADLSFWNRHFTQHGGEDLSGNGHQPSADEDIGDLGQTGRGSAASESQTRVYLHVSDRLPEGAVPPIVLPPAANTVVGPVGAGGRDVTVVVYAIDYEELSGLHIAVAWPRSWELQNVEPDLLPSQIMGYADGYSIERGAYMTVFDCQRGGDPIPVGRFDIHTDRAGGVEFNALNPLLRVVDCSGDVVDVRGAPFSPEAGRLAGDGNDQVATKVLLSKRAEGLDLTTAAFQLYLPRAGEVTARVYSVAGRCARTVMLGRQLGAGTHPLIWDGATDSGSPAPSGQYFLEVWAGGERLVERMLLVR